LIRLEGKFAKLLVLLGFCLVVGGIFSMIGMALVSPLFGIAMTDISQVLGDLSSPQNITILKFLQLFNTIGLFILPAILFAWLFIKQPIEFLKMNKEAKPFSILLVVGIFASFLPLVNWSVEWNSYLELPPAMEGLELWMKNAENRAMELTKAFLVMDSTGALWFNVLLIGLLPALGEELIFRGIVQRVLNENRRNYHIGIWVSAILFSALHMQFYGFLPRMSLGALFGYLYAWSGSLWIPIFAHFLNNTTALVAAYFLGSEIVEKEFDQLGTTEETYIFSAIALVAFIGLMAFFKKSHSLRAEPKLDA